jgi:hypothetical protein
MLSKFNGLPGGSQEDGDQTKFVSGSNIRQSHADAATRDCSII